MVEENEGLMCNWHKERWGESRFSFYYVDANLCANLLLATSTDCVLVANSSIVLALYKFLIIIIIIIIILCVKSTSSMESLFYNV